MESMFDGASSFDQILCGIWRQVYHDKSKGEKVITENMFEGCNGRIGNADECLAKAAINTQTTIRRTNPRRTNPRRTTTRTAAFKPSSKDELANAIGSCVLEDSAISELTEDSG